jgi:hypothetical protein
VRRPPSSRRIAPRTGVSAASLAPDIAFSTKLSVAERASAHNIMSALSCNSDAFVAVIRA